jgi:methylenetetrahydrofolate reductase (NADPH)
MSISELNAAEAARTGPAGKAAGEESAVHRVMADLVVTASLEMGAHRPDDAAAIAGLLPAGTSVFVNHLPRHALSETLASLVAAREAGLSPVPHLAVRRIGGREEAEQFLARAVRLADVSKVLLLGGDADRPAGPFNEAADLLDDRLLPASGIREVAFAAYPEGHPRIPAGVLADALLRKLERADHLGLGASIVTQFSFAPHRIIELATSLQRRAPGLPVYVGLAGPTNPRTLLKFAQVCGVSASLRALVAAGMGAVRLVTHTDPGRQLAAVARHVAAETTPNIVGVHVFSFGGVVATATWMNEVIRRT